MDLHRRADDLLVELLDRVVMRRDATALGDYLHGEFRLSCNGATHERAALLVRAGRAMLLDQGYAVDIDDEAWVGELDRVACRLWLTLTPPDADPSESELVVIATVRDGRFHHAWILCWPDRPAHRTAQHAPTPQSRGLDPIDSRTETHHDQL